MQVMISRNLNFVSENKISVFRNKFEGKFGFGPNSELKGLQRHKNVAKYFHEKVKIAT